MQTLVSHLVTNSQSANHQPTSQDYTFLEASLYTDPAWLPLEMKHIFRRAWLYVGDAADLSQPGTVKAVEVAGRSILIIRTEDNRLNAFHNVCPHRASPFVYDADQHSMKHLVCPYHGWVYNLDGQLLGTPAQKRFPEVFCTDQFPLHSVRLETWADFMFVCFDATTPPLLDYLHPIPTLMQGYRTEATQRLFSRDYAVSCNWKNFHDNTLCDYHVAIAHRQTLSPLQGPVRYYEHEFGDYVNLLHTPIPPQWHAAHPQVLDHLPERNQRGFYTYGIFPNLHLFALPNGQFGWVQINPRTVDTCQVRADVYGIPDWLPPIEDVAADFDATTQEDIILTEGVQQGYTSGAYTAGIANELEARIIHHQKLMRQWLLAGLTPQDNPKG